MIKAKKIKKKEEEAESDEDSRLFYILDLAF